MLAFIGGTGLTRMDDLEIRHRHDIETRYGKPSAPVAEGELNGVPVLFLARHGDPHVWLPHQVNYRANMQALKDAGATAIVAVNAVGGITAPAGALVLPEQIIDYTWGRDSTLFDDPNDPLVHVDFSWPFDPVLRRRLRGALERAGLQWVDGGCYAATQGPRLETAAEIRRMARDGCDMVGMTGMPEASIARELGLCYAAIAVSANNAAGRHAGPLEMEGILKNVARGMEVVRSILAEVLKGAKI